MFTADAEVAVTCAVRDHFCRSGHGARLARRQDVSASWPVKSGHFSWNLHLVALARLIPNLPERGGAHHCAAATGEAQVKSEDAVRRCEQVNAEEWQLSRSEARGSVSPPQAPLFFGQCDKVLGP